MNQADWLRKRLRRRLGCAPEIGAIVGIVLTVYACAPEPLPLPTESDVAAAVAAEPPLYRELYDYAFLPEIQQREQRVRLLVWLRHVGFTRYQLDLWKDLAARVAQQRAEAAAARDAILGAHEPAVGAAYDRIWEALLAGTSNAELGRLAPELDVRRDRERALLELRARSVRTVFTLEEPLLRSLTAGQEAMIADATFLLRHRLDPYANPGDFTALVGSVWTAGEFGVLTKATFDPDEDHLDVGGLWSSKEGGRAPFPETRRQVVVYMVALEPALPEAIDAAILLRAGTVEPEPTGAAPGSEGRAAAGAPPSDVGVGPRPGLGIPEEPAPGIPDAPAPGPGAPAEPAPGIPVEPPPGVP